MMGVMGVEKIKLKLIHRQCVKNVMWLCTISHMMELADIDVIVAAGLWIIRLVKVTSTDTKGNENEITRF